MAEFAPNPRLTDPFAAAACPDRLPVTASHRPPQKKRFAKSRSAKPETSKAAARRRIWEEEALLFFFFALWVDA